MHDVGAIPPSGMRTSTGAPMPRITPLTWASAREVLPHEAHDFTPWLADHLDLLADVLGLDDLALVAREWDVETFSLDLFAVGSDLKGEIHVVIENQYGVTDHRHLGQLMTYAAHAASGGGRVLAVWVTEDVRPAHLAAVEFLNRMSAAESATFGAVLLRVRFVPIADGSFGVYFEVESEPNSFLRQGGSLRSGGRPETAQARRSFIEQVSAILTPEIVRLGYRGGAVNPKHGTITYLFPLGNPLAKVASIRVVAKQHFAYVALYLEHLPTAEENHAVAEVIQEHYAPLLSQYGVGVSDWHASSPTTKRARIRMDLDARGFGAADPTTVASQAEIVLRGWLGAATERPLMDVEARWRALLTESGPGSMETDAAGEMDELQTSTNGGVMVDKTALTDEQNVSMVRVEDGEGVKPWTAAQRAQVLGGGALPPVQPKKLDAE